MTPGVTSCIMRRGGSLFCVVAPLSPLLRPGTRWLVEKSLSLFLFLSPPPDSPFAATLLSPFVPSGSGPSRRKKLLQPVSEANSEGLTGVPQRGDKNR